MPTDTKIRLTVVQSGVGTPLDALIHVSTPAVLDGRETLAREWHPEGSGPQRASSYIVYVDLPDDSEHMLLTHSYTGAYDRVSRRVATYVRSLEPGHAPKPLYGRWSPEPPIDGNVVAPAADTIERLRRRGYLTRMTQEEEETYFTYVASRLHHVSSQR